MIKPAFRALLVPGVGPPPLLEASLLAASGAAIAMAAVAVRADEKHRATLFAHANSLPENPFAVNRHHAFSQAGGRQRQIYRGINKPVWNRKQLYRKFSYPIDSYGSPVPMEVLTDEVHDLTLIDPAHEELYLSSNGRGEYRIERRRSRFLTLDPLHYRPRVHD